MISRITYGYDPDAENDRYIWVASQCENIIAQAGRPGAYLVDIFPICSCHLMVSRDTDPVIVKYIPRWLPFAGFKRQAMTWSLLVQELLESPFTFVKEKMVRGIGD